MKTAIPNIARQNTRGFDEYGFVSNLVRGEAESVLA
jgi:hypothetical protein